MANGLRRLRAANLLVGVDEEDRVHRGPFAKRLECANGEYRLHQSSLHVKNAWAMKSSVGKMDGHFFDRAQRPNRITVAKQQLERASPLPDYGTSKQMAAQLAAANSANIQSRGFERVV